MANYAMTAVSSTVTTGVFESEGYKVRKHVIKWADATSTKGSALVQNDTVDVLPIYAGELVVGAFMRIITAGTGSSTCQVGDSAQAAGYIASTALDATAGTVSLSPGTLTTANNFVMVQASSGAYAVTFTGGKFYTSNNTLRVKINSSTAPIAGVVEFGLIYLPVSSSTTV